MPASLTLLQYVDSTHDHHAIFPVGVGRSVSSVTEPLLCWKDVELQTGHLRREMQRDSSLSRRLLYCARMHYNNAQREQLCLLILDALRYVPDFDCQQSLCVQAGQSSCPVTGF